MNRASAGVSLVGVFGVLFAGCLDVGSGDGEASGPMYIKGCKNFDNAVTPATFDLHPSFFAGEPVEDIRDKARENRLTIRLQRRGGGLIDTDTLAFDIVNSYEVARCVLGLYKPDGNGQMVPDFRADLCHWMSPTGPARVRVGPHDFVRATLTPFKSCRSKNVPLNVVGTAVPCKPVNGKADCPDLPPDQWGSFIEFHQFGSADVSTPAEKRNEISPDFKIDFGRTVGSSNFVLDLVDDHFLVLPIGPSTPTEPAIAGTMHGWFEFDFERGRALQTFP